jgi:hypothetical protein
MVPELVEQTVKPTLGSLFESHGKKRLGIYVNERLPIVVSWLRPFDRAPIRGHPDSRKDSFISQGGKDASELDLFHEAHN